MGRGVGRPTSPQLDRASIGDAALELVDREGTFSMPALARALDVRVSSLYHHVDGRSAVVELVRDRVTAGIGGHWFDALAWDAAVEHWARDYRTAFAAHPHAVRLLATETVVSRQSVDVYAAAAAALLRAGFPVAEVLPVITAIEDFILGAALDAVAPDEVIAVADEDDAEPLRRSIAAAPSGPERAQRAFDLGLAALITGLRARLVQWGGD